MHRRVPPPLVEKPARPIQMLEIILIRLAAPEFHVCDFKIAPEMTRAVAVRFKVMIWSPLAVLHPLPRTVLVEILGVGGDEFFGLGPERGDGLRGVVQVDREAVGFVVVGHVAEDVVVDVAEEVHLGLHPPVVACVRQRGVFVEHAAVPAAHLVVRYHGAVLDFLLFEHLGGFVEEVAIYPIRDCPVFFWDYCCRGKVSVTSRVEEREKTIVP